MTILNIKDHEKIISAWEGTLHRTGKTNMKLEVRTQNFLKKVKMTILYRRNIFKKTDNLLYKLIPIKKL